MAMRTLVESSQIASIGYDPQTEILEVEFKGRGAVYEYYNVPKDVYDTLMVSESVGSDFNTLVKAAGYEYRKVN
jgi:hypothetical protein